MSRLEMFFRMPFAFSDCFMMIIPAMVVSFMLADRGSAKAKCTALAVEAVLYIIIVGACVLYETQYHILGWIALFGSPWIFGAMIGTAANLISGMIDSMRKGRK